MSAEPTQLRYFVDTNVLGIIATRTHPLRIGYLALIAAEELDDRTPSISTIVADEVKAGLSTLDAGGSTAQQLAAATRTVRSREAPSVAEPSTQSRRPFSES